MAGMNKWLRRAALLMAVCVFVTGLTCGRVRAEDTEEIVLNLSDEELATLEGDNTEDAASTGKVYEEKTKEDFDLNSPALYIGKITNIQKSYSIFAEKSRFRRLILEERRLKGPEDVPALIPPRTFPKSAALHGTRRSWRSPRPGRPGHGGSGPFPLHPGAGSPSWF
mgnify:CR=1 FL=1